MHCEQVKIELSNNPAKSSLIKRFLIRNHTNHCLDCREFELGARKIDQLSATLFATARPVHPRFYAEFARESHSIPVRWSALFAAGLTAVVAIGLFSAPRSLSANALSRVMIQAVNSVSTVHMSVYWRTDHGHGPMNKVYEIWGSGQQTREIAPPDLGGDRIKDFRSSPPKFYRFDDHLKRVQVMSELAPSAFPKVSYESLTHDYFPNGSFPTYKDLGFVMENGRSFQKLEADWQDWDRITFFLDPHTHLPARFEKQFRDHGKWITSGVAQFEFNISIPESKFNPKTLEKRP